MSDKRIEINVPVLARVEGEGALDLVVVNENIEQLRLRIFEPPRMFEKFLEGRHFSEVPDVVARICGICPVAYQITAVKALERGMGVTVTPWIERMRQVLYFGEWLQSHALHIHLLALPDFLGFNAVTQMAQQYPEEVRRGIRLQGAGNRIISLFGGRSVHPVGVKVGGFHGAPSSAEVDDLLRQLPGWLDDAEALLAWLATLSLPEQGQEFINMALTNDTYNAIDGRIQTSTQEQIEEDKFELAIEEVQVPHSTAFHAHLRGQPYLVGPLARFRINHQALPARIKEQAEDLLPAADSGNMFYSILARALEILWALEETQRLLRDYVEETQPSVAVEAVSCNAAAATEAPRGLLWHRYQVDEGGRLISARIIPPTSQNQARIEEDLRLSLQAFGLDRTETELRARAEQVIRNYDPCISCATHFLRLNLTRH